jgi:hypothetical protein
VVPWYVDAIIIAILLIAVVVMAWALQYAIKNNTSAETYDKMSSKPPISKARFVMGHRTLLVLIFVGSVTTFIWLIIQIIIDR